MDSTAVSWREKRMVLSRAWWWGRLVERNLAALKEVLWVTQMAVMLVVQMDTMWGSSLGLMTARVLDEMWDMTLAD